MVPEDVCPECGCSLIYDYACQDIGEFITEVSTACVLCNYKWTQKIRCNVLRIFSRVELEYLERILTEDVLGLSAKLDKLWEEYDSKQTTLSKIRRQQRLKAELGDDS